MSSPLNKPLFPGWYMRFICRKVGHFPYKSRWLCVRCGDLLDEGDRIQTTARNRYPELFEEQS